MEYIAYAAGFRVARTDLLIDAVGAAAVAAALELETVSYDAEPLLVVAPTPSPVDTANSYVAKDIEVVDDTATE